MENATTRLMFGYQCFSISRKFFVGFSNKNNFQVIIRLPKDQQELAIKKQGNRTLFPWSQNGMD